MPELVTHTCVALLARAPSQTRYLPVFVAGSTLPDILSRVPSLLLLKLHGLGVPVPELLVYAFTPLHLPAGILLWSLCLSLLFPQQERRAVLLNLLAGAALHLALDLMQYHNGTGYPLLYPFSAEEYEIGLFGSEASVPIALPLAAVTAAIYGGLRWWRGRGATHGGGTEDR